MGAIKDSKQKIKLLLLRPFYGITVHGDMHGDLGISDHHPHIYPDLSFIYAATIASQAPHVDLHVIDANSSELMPAGVWEQMDDYYDIIIIKAAAPTVRYDLKFVGEIIKRYPFSKIVLAGLVADLIRSWIKGKLPGVHDIARIPMEYYVHNLIWGNSDIHMNDLPSPDYTLFPYEKFRDMDGNLRASLYTSRGCAVGCSYCPYSFFYGRSMEFRSTENVIKDIKHLLSMGIRKILFRDQYFSINAKRTKEICETIIKEGLKFSWECETRLESLTPELIDLMTAAGMDMVCFGVETAAIQTLKTYNRPPVDENRLIRLINYLHSKKVMTIAFYMIGFPHDTWKTIRSTFELAVRLASNSAKFSIFSPCTPEVYQRMELSPAEFSPFENTMATNPCKNLSRKELEFLVDHLNNLYHTEIVQKESKRKNYIEVIYKFHVIHQMRYHALVKSLKKRLLEDKIFNIAMKKGPRRKMHVYKRI
jgi:radical SAM superfamily enzyme YgiQ (UPF0313 family)